jgi:2-polyprenyl-3-methyl-5-hydroxy-6-metoxy-1,4-benzoquinol methylase
MSEAPDHEELLRRLRERVEERRRAGAFPPGLEAELDDHFAKLTGERPSSPSFSLDELEEAVAELRAYAFGRDRIPLESRLPGGTAMHRMVGKTVARQIQGVLDQVQDQSRRVAHALTLLAGITGNLGDAFDKRLLQQLDDLQLQLAEQQRTLNGLRARIDEVTARVPGVAVATWYSADAFTAAFRGSVADMRSRYRDLAERFAGCDPVLDIGFGRGEFLELLRDLGVDAFGIEVDPDLVGAARSRGLRAEQGTAVEYLRTLDDASLGGLVMIQVIEHLTPQHVVDVVRVAADKVRRGGRVLVETVNPTSLFTYAHALWVDPDHVRPVHPNFLEFLFGEAGFANVERIDRSPVAADESLELLPGEDETTKRLNANFERLNGLLFGPQDYAVLATR